MGLNIIWACQGAISAITRLLQLQNVRDFVHFKHTDFISPLVHRDMIQLIRSDSWALLPSLDTLRKIRDLFAYNNKTSTSTVARKLFTAVRLQLEL